MMKFLALVLLTVQAHAYVPTVESLFRHGSNPDVSANGVSLTLVVKRVQGGEKAGATGDDALVSEKAEDFYKIFFTKSGDSLKVAQSRYSNGSFNESSLMHKIYYPNFSAYTVKPGVETAEKGIFFALLDSMVLNNGSHMVNYLKALGVPVKLNSEIINREKVEFLADYKRYLVLISKDRNARKTEVNPMQPTDSAARERADAIMNEPMYTDTKQVKLSKDDGQIVWALNAGSFDAVFSYNTRDVQKVKFRTNLGEYEIICKDYWLANGTHALPRYMLVKTFSGQQFQIEITNLRHYVEREDDLVRRLKNWDSILKGKESPEPRPEFML